MEAALLTEWYQAAGIIIALPVAGACVWGVIRAVRHFGTVHEAIVGRAAGPANEHIPSLIERFHAIDQRFDGVDAHLARQDEQIAEVSREFRTNGGSTVKDDLTALKRQIDAK